MTKMLNDPTAPWGGIDLAMVGDTSRVVLSGDVDAALRDQASAVMADVVLRDGPVVVDTSNVHFLDSTGLAFVLQLVRVGEEDGRDVVLQDPPMHVTDLIDVVGMRARSTVRRTPADPEPVAHSATG